LGGLATHVKALSLTLPDRFDRLAGAAESLERLVRGREACA
jgi:hypothetical protein